MTSLRDEREAAFWPLWRRWGQEPKDFATALLDEFDVIDRAHVPDGIIKFDIDEAEPMTGPPMTDQERREFAEQWLEAKDGPAVQRALGVVAELGTGSVPPPGPVPPVPVSDTPPKAPPAARTASRRRTTR